MIKWIEMIEMKSIELTGAKVSPAFLFYFSELPQEKSI